MIEYIDLINKKLEEYFPGGGANTLEESMMYSLSLPGKRVRPMLTLEFCSVCGGDINAALPFACAVEMIHTFSLIHDDLPCMDNDDFRRGKPSNHKVYGEDIALLAGDALLTKAFEIILSDVVSVEPEKAMRAAYILAVKSGSDGVAGGQMIDLQSEGKRVDTDTLREMDEKKTANLIEAACMMGCVAAGADDEKILASERYARNIGMAFQIIDDILDVTSSTEELGKPVGSDADNEKSTYVSLLGIEQSRKLADEYTDNAVKALKAFDGDTSRLEAFAYKLASRTK